MSKKESPKMMVLHGIGMAIVSYFIMVYFMKQSKDVAEYRSVLLLCFSILYMIHFGHALPSFD